MKQPAEAKSDAPARANEGKKRTAAAKVSSRRSLLRLSWPNPGNSRRAILGKFPIAAGEPGRQANAAHIVHVSFQDVEAEYRMLGLQQIPQSLDVPLPWNPTETEAESQELLKYFQEVASASLAIIGHEPIELGKLLVKIAVDGDSTSSQVVFRSIIAFAALHRHQVHTQAVQLKISALKTLGTASTSDAIGTAEAIQHIAAGMLLLSLEIHQASCTSGDWTWYLDGVKEVIRNANLDEDSDSPKLSMLLDWIYYHDVLSRFCLSHWKLEVVEAIPEPRRCLGSSVFRPPPTGLLQDAQIAVKRDSHVESPALVLTGLLAEVSATASSDLSDSASNSDKENFLKILEWRIRNLAVISSANESTGNGSVTELFRLAVLVYLNRAAEDALNSYKTTQKHVERAFSLITQMETCIRQFPLFIFGCEARSDDQRRAVLDLLSRTEKQQSSRSCNYVRIILQASWAQDDLADGEMEYRNPPDLLGFAQVSGFYGPGAWAAWFIVVIASWVHILFHNQHGNRKLDVNLWIYLLVLNWAAIDLFIQGRSIGLLYNANLTGEGDPWTQKAARVGAAMTVVFWGAFHGQTQLLVSAYGPYATTDITNGDFTLAN
ncbi:hypothetical protein OQA88_5472 [Cercophora sp. LCS_1]